MKTEYKEFLVVGGHGFIGSHFCKRLKPGSFDIYDTGLYNGNPSAALVAKRKSGLPESVAFIDLPKKVYKYVIHFGSLAGVRNGNSDLDFIFNNVDRLAVLKKYVRTEKWVYISSSSVLGDVDTAYKRSKLAAEQLFMDDAALIVRPFTVFGEHGRPEMLVSLCANGKPMRVHGDPTKIRRYLTYVEDLVTCILSHLDYIGTINAVGHKKYTVKEVLDLFCVDYEIGQPSPYDFDKQTMDVAKIYVCTTPLEEKIEDLRKDALTS